MKDGKKTVAKRIFTNTMAEIRANGHMNPRVVFDAALESLVCNIIRGMHHITV